MQTITLAIPGKDAQAAIVVGNGSIGELNSIVGLARYSRVLVVGDSNVSQWVETVREKLPADHTVMELPSGEQAKHIGTVQQIWQALLDAGCDRKSLLIAVGGGVIGDMAGFAATTYMRGIDFVHVPTSLLAQVDSSVGGKTGINFAGVKNLVGTFAQAICTVIDTQTLQTLPRREFVSGFGELIKHGLIRDEAFLKLVTSKRPEEFSLDEMADIIAWSCRIKASVVMEDERESGLRKFLNFGHTVGHAVEALGLESDEPLLHGEAVSIGMVVEAELACLQGLLSPEERNQVAAMLEHAGLPTRVPATFSTDALLAKMRSDKKNVGGSIRFTLLEKIGSAVWDKPANETEIANAIESWRNTA